MIVDLIDEHRTKGRLEFKINIKRTKVKKEKIEEDLIDDQMFNIAEDQIVIILDSRIIKKVVRFNFRQRW